MNVVDKQGLIIQGGTGSFPTTCYDNFYENPDYTDMLQMFVEKGDIPKLDVMFVDEAQDLSPLQWSVVRRF